MTVQFHLSRRLILAIVTVLLLGGVVFIVPAAQGRTETSLEAEVSALRERVAQLENRLGHVERNMGDGHTEHYLCKPVGYDQVAQLKVITRPIIVPEDWQAAVRQYLGSRNAADAARVGMYRRTYYSSYAPHACGETTPAFINNDGTSF